MPAAEVAHPSPEQLRAFALGQLPPDAQDEVARHVADCDACCQALRGIPDDSLLQRLRRAPAQTPTEYIGVPGAAPDSSEAVPPELVDHPRYRILARLGEGGMGTVWKAEHRIMERFVALKVISPSLISNPQAVERFRQEVKAAARLSHPNVVAALDADQAGNLHFLVMEFVDGINLGRLVEKKGALAVPHACSFTRQAALGLQHAHEQGMIHRDVKPHNLMVTRKGQVKILDFGLARFATVLKTDGETRAPGKALTSVDVVLGTPDYLAPEQARNSRNVDGRADLYGLGCTLYYLLTGRVPFPGGSSLDKLFAQCEEEAAPIEELRPEVPPDLAAVVRKLMEKDPAKRYQTAAEVVAALGPFARAGSPALTLEQPVEERPTSPTPPRPTPAKTQTISADPLHETPAASPKERRQPRRKAGPPMRRGWLIGGGIALVALLLVAGIVALVMNRGLERKQPRVLFVLASKGFYHPDYAPVREKLESGGIEVKVASTVRGEARSTTGTSVPVDVLLSEARAEDYDAVIFCGGDGVNEFFRNQPGGKAANDLIHAMLAAGKPVAAICMGPAVLADANVVRGKEVTFQKTPKINFEPKMKNEGRAIPRLDRSVVVDGLIITGRDPQSAGEFADAVARAVRK